VADKWKETVVVCRKRI